MSCNICQSKFSFFTKEVACPGCGFSYCGKCLKYKCTLPDRRVKKVCGRCHNKDNSKKEGNSKKEDNSKKEGNSKMEGNSMDATDMSQEQEEHLAPVDITKKLDSLENPAKPPIVMYKHANRWEKFKRGLEPADQEIVDRLRKLKEEDKTTALSVDEIKKRLALLKDEEPGDAGNSKINIHPRDSRTDQEKADDLIQEYLGQLELSSGNDPVSEIQSRLRSLQGLSNVHRKSGECINDDDEQHVTKKLITKALAEAALEKKYEEDVDELEEMEIDAPKHTVGGVKKEEKDDDDDDDNDDGVEKPTCVMCDQTKNLAKCLGCYGDLYCPVCYEDNHDEFELGKHRKVPHL